MHGTLISLVIDYKYAFLIPAAFVEGHVIALIAGFLARLGYLNLFLAGACVAFGNLLGDVALYWLGYHKGAAIATGWGRYFGITEASIKRVTRIFNMHKSHILLTSKLTNGFGLAMAVLFTAGITRIPFRSYMFWNVLGEIMWTGMLVSLGFFLGQLYTIIDDIVWRVSVIGVLVTLGILALRLIMYHNKKCL
ncbi:MAG: VTT domain-containing protein [Candidatus Moranbacteria bacterium]|nr:VTT domain-containing protein [Candidatus Moranbacteria bacterium]